MKKSYNENRPYTNTSISNHEGLSTYNMENYQDEIPFSDQLEYLASQKKAQ